MTKIVTVLKTEAGFCDIEAFDGELLDSGYVEGAILWNHDGKVILDERHWDLIDPLWCYLVDGVEALREGQRFQTYFPDQPLLLGMRLLGDGYLEVTVGEQRSKMPETVLSDVLMPAARDFFRRMMVIARGGSAYQPYALKAEALIGNADGGVK